MKGKTTRTYVTLALLSAIAFVLQLFEFSLPIPIIPAFLKLDASDLPAMFAVLTSGGIAGIVVQIIKNILHAIFFGWSGGLGELSNIIVGTGVILPYLIAKNRDISAKSVIVSGITSIFTICVAAFISNSLITPIYMNTTLEVVMTFMPGIMVFNAVKAVVIMVLTLLARIPMIKIAKLRN